MELENTAALFPAELSGGMKRRVAIASAMISNPEILLYDSPTAGLDPVTSTTIVELLVKQRDVYQTSALLVTHRLQDAFTMATHRFNHSQNRMVRGAARHGLGLENQLPGIEGRQEDLRGQRGGHRQLR